MFVQRLRGLVAVALAAGGLGLLPARAVAQEASGDTLFFVLPPIDVTAERERASAPPVATIVVAPERLRTAQHRNSYDLIRRVTGIEVHDAGQGPGFSSSVVLRGFTADHSSDLLLAIDGVPVNLPVHGHIEGYADWSFLFPGAIGSLRVIHGPASPLYGDFSISGAVEVFTQADADGTRGGMSATGVGDLSGWLTTGRHGERGGALLGAELRRGEGWRDNSGQRLGNALLRGWRSVGGGRLEGGLALHGAEWSAPGFLSLSDFDAERLEGAADASDGGEQRRVVGHARYAVPFGSDRFLQAMAWGIGSRWESFLHSVGHVDALGSPYQSGESDERWGAGGELEHSWIPGWGELTVGTSYRTDRSSYDRDHTLRRRRVEEELALDAEHRAFGAFLRWRHTLFGRLGLDVGGRLDHLRYRSYNRLGLPEGEARMDPLDPPVGRHVIGGQGPVGAWIGGRETVVSPKLGARLALAERWSLAASSSRGFRSAPGVLGDPDRPPLLAWAHELGLHFEGDALAGHLSLFRTDVANERIQDPATLEISSAGSSVRQGVEVDADLVLGGGWQLSGRGSYTDARLSGRYADAHQDHGEDAPAPGPQSDDEGQRVPGVARYQAQLSVEGPLLAGLSAWGGGRVSGPYVPIGEPDAETDPYAVLDLGLRFPEWNDLVVELELENALDEVYADMRSSGFVSPGAPRMLGIIVNYVGRRGRSPIR